MLQANNDVYEFLSGSPVTPRTLFVNVSRDDTIQTVAHYMRYALAAYGWPIYMIMNTTTGLCRILPRLRSVRWTRLFFHRNTETDRRTGYMRIANRNAFSSQITET